MVRNNNQRHKDESKAKTTTNKDHSKDRKICFGAATLKDWPTKDKKTKNQEISYYTITCSIYCLEAILP